MPPPGRACADLGLRAMATFSVPYTKLFPTLSCAAAKDEDDDGLSDLGDEESGEDGDSQKNLPNYNMANVSLVEEGR